MLSTCIGFHVRTFFKYARSLLQLVLPIVKVKGVSLQKDKAGLTVLHAQREENNENRIVLRVCNNAGLNQSADWSLRENDKDNFWELHEYNVRQFRGASN